MSYIKQCQYYSPVLKLLRLFFIILLASANISYARFIDDLDQNLVDDSKSFFNLHARTRLVSDLTIDDNYQSSQRQNEYKDTRFKNRIYSKFAINNNLYLRTQFRVERMDSNAEIERRNQLNSGGGSRSFENIGANIEEINLNYKIGNLAFKAGKTNLNFGKAWFWERGMWAYQLPRNYKQTEKLGLGTIYKIGNESVNGAYNFSFVAFKNDSKNLDNSIFTKRDSTAKSENKVGDRTGLKSYVAALDVDLDFGEKYNAQEKLSYHFAYMNQELRDKSMANIDYIAQDQESLAFSMHYILPIYHNFTLDAMYEFADLQNIDGNSNISQRYNTISVINRIFQNYNITLASSNLVNKEANALGFDQILSEISVGYELKNNKFFDNLLLQMGYKNQRIDYKNRIDKQNSIGLLIRYIKYF